VVFANPGTSLIEAGRVEVQVLSKPVYCHVTGFLLGALAQCRGTSLIGARNMSRCRILDCGQVRASGCKFQQDLSWEQGAAKTMTNNLPILSVLALGLIF